MGEPALPTAVVFRKEIIGKRQLEEVSGPRRVRADIPPFIFFIVSSLLCVAKENGWSKDKEDVAKVRRENKFSKGGMHAAVYSQS